MNLNAPYQYLEAGQWATIESSGRIVYLSSRELGVRYQLGSRFRLGRLAII